jgi:osmoprotectant transport system permease protein
MMYAIDHLGRIAGLTLEHLELVAAALATAFAIALPLGTFAARRGPFAGPLLGTLAAIYTIPSLALLALLVRLLGLGIVPIFAALVAYAQFMLVRSVVTGLHGVDRAAVDAARGLGMSDWQRLVRVEFPLATPVILGGVRIAAVAMVALATLGGYVGAGGLGTLIFTGLAIHHTDEIVAGSLAACLLAIAIDVALRGLERASAR